VRRVSFFAVVSMVLLGVFAGDASATTWSGKCDMTQTTSLVRPSYIVPKEHGYQIRGKGTCDGLLDGRAYKGPATIFIDGRMDRLMSCETGWSTDIPGTLTFGAPRPVVKPAPVQKGKKKKRKKAHAPPPPPEIGLTFAEMHLLTQLRLQVSGAYSGNGFVTGTYKANPQDLVTCAKGGIDHLDGDLHMTTFQQLYG
jgi:hypothetical protein